MNLRKMIASDAVLFTLSVTLVAAQMQTPDNSAGKQNSAASKTLTGIVADSMRGVHHMAKARSAWRK